MEVNEILERLGISDSDVLAIRRFQREEDGTDYDVWQVSTAEKDYVLKQAKEYEAEVYQTFLCHAPQSTPRLYAQADMNGKTYLLMEYVPGEDLRHCTREKLVPALDALIALQERFWQSPCYASAGYSFEESLRQRRRRGTYLHDSVLQQAYSSFLEQYARLPRTLCHDDLLPFNVLIREGRAVIIDWECAGMLPYPTALARLIAHGTQEDDAFFYMTDKDRSFAIEYYYDRMLRRKGIAYDGYRRALEYFFLYEYCEWVMIGEKYGDTDSARYRHYLRLAKQQAEKCLLLQESR